MKFAVFIGYTYYARGGWNDHVGTFNSYQAAVEKVDKFMEIEHDHDWFQIVNLITGKIVKEDGEIYAMI